MKNGIKYFLSNLLHPRIMLIGDLRFLSRYCDICFVALCGPTTFPLEKKRTWSESGKTRRMHWKIYVAISTPNLAETSIIFFHDQLNCTHDHSRNQRGLRCQDSPVVRFLLTAHMISVSNPHSAAISLGMRSIAGSAISSMGSEVTSKARA